MHTGQRERRKTEYGPKEVTAEGTPGTTRSIISMQVYPDPARNESERGLPDATNAMEPGPILQDYGSRGIPNLRHTIALSASLPHVKAAFARQPVNSVSSPKPELVEATKRAIASDVLIELFDDICIEYHGQSERHPY